MATKPKSDGRMEPTLIRFDPELLARTKSEAAKLGVSVAQYVREAVVARIAYTEGRREGRLQALAERAERALDEAARVRSEKRAVLAENELTVAQARRRREEARETRDRKSGD